MRKLASIQKITDIKPIEGADNIEVASVLGWHVVIGKGQFKVGDIVVYCEIDSILPDKPEFEFLRPRGFRIRTIRLRGQISQGICFSTDILPEGTYEEGSCVTELLGVEKYEPYIPTQLSGVIKGSFPSFIPKTDEPRVQILQDVLLRYATSPFEMHEKLDGSSVTYYIKDGEFGVCSRNIELKESEDNTFWRMAKELHIEHILRSYSRIPKNVAVQGELVGPGVQGNKLKLDKNTVYFYNIFDIDNFKYLRIGHEFATECGLNWVPFLGNIDLPSNVDDLVAISTIKSVINPSVWAEGIVFRPTQEIVDLRMATGLGNGRLSFKVNNPEFLLKYE